MEEREKSSVHLGFRVRPELHRELQQLAKTLNLDLSGLVNTMLAEAAPTMRARAEELRARDEASKGPYPVNLADWPLVQRAITAGMLAKKDRLSAMKKVITDVVGAKYPSFSSVLLRAEHEVNEIMRVDGGQWWFHEHGFEE